MDAVAIVDEFARCIRLRSDKAALVEALSRATDSMGFRYFAVIHHVDFERYPSAGLRFHNYPAKLVERFDAEKRGPTDPIHRASHLTASCFRWRDVAKMVKLSKHDQQILSDAREQGVGDGLTKPAHIPGEARASISFATETGRPFPEAAFYPATVIGDLAFEALRRSRRPLSAPRPRVTDRQLDCIIWVGRGKKDGEIADILGVRRSTVIEHLRAVREAWDADARSVLPLRAMLEGVLCIADFFPSASPFLGMF